MIKSILQKRSHLIPAVITALMLFGSLGAWPYGYYQLLRFVVCGSGAYIAIISSDSEKKWLTWLFGIIAFLFNPLIPIHLTREIWQVIDVICALIFFVILFIPINDYE